MREDVEDDFTLGRERRAVRGGAAGTRLGHVVRHQTLRMRDETSEGRQDIKRARGRACKNVSASTPTTRTMAR